MLVVLANCYKVKSCFRHYENCGVSGRLHRFGSVLEHVESHMTRFDMTVPKVSGKLNGAMLVMDEAHRE